MTWHPTHHGLALFFAFACPAAAQTRATNAQPPRLSVEPRQASGGSLVRLTIDRLDGHGADSVVAISGEMANERLHFVGGTKGRQHAIGAVPIDVGDSLMASAWLHRASGAVDTLRVVLPFPHRLPPPPATSGRGRSAGASRLRVDTRFTRPLDTATAARVERENQLARDIGRRAQNTPKLWIFPFLRPRSALVTSRFGTGRVFNGKVSSNHLGVDYKGSVGEPIRAANRGVVALVGEFFLAGNVVYLDHGNGIVTGYFHMSKPEVAAGDTVERGQEIGLVGATGRVTGPHLHWSARFGALTIDPGDLLALSAPFVAPETMKGKKSGRK